MEIKTNAIIPVTAGEDLSNKEGFLVKLLDGKAILVTAATDIPFGVVIDGAESGSMASIAVCGGNVGTLHISAGGTIAQGAYMQLEAEGDVITDAGTGARVIVGVALEAATDGALIEAVMITPTAKT